MINKMNSRIPKLINKNDEITKNKNKLEKNVKEEFNEENIIKNFVFIAARKVIKIEFEEYINRLRKELRNDFEENENIVIKRKMRAPFLEEDIVEGIKLGMKIE